MGKLVIVRHGESTWNAEGKWTGTTNVHLSEKGLHEAELMGERLHDLKFDHAFISQQIRTMETLQGILQYSASPNVPTTIAGALNERDYGSYTGQNKWEVKKAIGDEAFELLRRSWDYPVPGGETLKAVYERVLPYYQTNILPELIAGKTILIGAHGNSIRSLVKYLENISDEQISTIEMIFGTALIYTVDEAGRMATKEIRQIDSPPPVA
jgi:2,3-bisphosphoglycerate-dependent phosphoglycerate mutase